MKHKISLSITVSFLTLVVASSLSNAETVSRIHPVSVRSGITPMCSQTTNSTSDMVDTLRFGDAASEQAHDLKATLSDTVVGGLHESARRLLPRDPPTWEGGRLAFTLKVDPKVRNYVTVRLWGDDRTETRLVLFCEGKQIGYHHLGDVDLLDFGNDGDGPGLNGRFFYNTSPLPLEMTVGKTELHFEIRSIGRIWPYGTTFEQYQYALTQPTRGIYTLYTHTNGYFQPPAAEPQGEKPAHEPLRTSPGLEVLDALKARLNGEIDRELNSGRPLNQMEMQYLARAYYVTWTHAYRNPNVVDRVREGMDRLYLSFVANPKLVQLDPATPNPDWYGMGPAATAIRYLIDPLKPGLDAQISNGQGGMIARRAAWSQVLVAARDWHRAHRRQYTNQSIIIDMCFYSANRAIQLIDPDSALSEERMLHFLYQSVGLEPWLGSDTDHGPEKPVGENYFEFTKKGLTRELGFVGYYGEILDWIAQLYDATRPDPDHPGDPKIKDQLELAAHARAYFRYPALDADGNRAMRAETIVGWRDAHYPGDVTYAERVSWDGSALYAPAITMDEKSIGAAQQMFEDNQFFNSVKERMQDRGFRVTAGLLGVPDQYVQLAAASKSSLRLPMSPGQPDFAWADEEDGVVAIKHGTDILYASVYWRARFGINNLARIHLITARFDRIAVVEQQEEFEPSGMMYTTPNWTDQGFFRGGFHYPGDLHQAQEGEKLPIAKMPSGVTFKYGEENSYAGRASFYTCRYGNYLIGMNSNEEKSYTLKIPAGSKSAPELISGKTVHLPAAGLAVKPMSTVVLYLPNVGQTVSQGAMSGNLNGPRTASDNTAAATP